jgi:hypothetical protein
MNARSVPLAFIIATAGCMKPGAADIALDAKDECEGALTLHFPRGWSVARPSKGLCVVAPPPESGFSSKAQLLAAIVPVGPKMSLDRAVDELTKGYAEKPGWTEKSRTSGTCYADRDGVEIIGSLVDDADALEMRICMFASSGQVIQLTAATDEKGTDAALVKRLAAAVELRSQ